MNKHFSELLNFMIPKVGDGLSGSYVWKSDQHSRTLEKKFLTFLEICLYNDAHAELATYQSDSGSFLYQLIFISLIY